MDDATDAVSTHVVGIGMRMDRAVGIVAVIVIVEIAVIVGIAAAVSVARVIVGALARAASGRTVAADAVLIAMEIGGRAAASDQAARKRKGIVARVRHGAMEVGATATVATGIVLKVAVATATAAVIPTGLTAIALRADVLTATVQTAAVVMGIVRRALVAMEIAATSIVTATAGVAAVAVARTPANRLRACVRMRQRIVPSTRRCRWPAARVMLA
jgi:hypothetical protein